MHIICRHTCKYIINQGKRPAWTWYCCPDDFAGLAMKASKISRWGTAGVKAMML